MTPIIPAPGQGPWRVLLLSMDPDDPFWAICTVADPADVHPALLSVGGEPGWHGAGQWVSSRIGRPVTLTSLDALVWRLDEGGPR